MFGHVTSKSCSQAKIPCAIKKKDNGIHLGVKIFLMIIHALNSSTISKQQRSNIKNTMMQCLPVKQCLIY
jgi:hypothetical protein